MGTIHQLISDHSGKRFRVRGYLGSRLEVHARVRDLESDKILGDVAINPDDWSALTNPQAGFASYCEFKIDPDAKQIVDALSIH